MKFIFYIGFTLCFVNTNAQVSKQVLDARILGIKSEDQLFKIETILREHKEIINTYHIYKGDEESVAKLVVEIKVEDLGEGGVEAFCSEDLKKIIIRNGFEPLAIKERTLKINEPFIDPDKGNKK